MIYYCSLHHPESMMNDSLPSNESCDIVYDPSPHIQALEAPHENLQRAKIVEMKQTTIAEIWKIAQVFKMKLAHAWTRQSYIPIIIIHRNIYRIIYVDWSYIDINCIHGLIIINLLLIIHITTLINILFPTIYIL